ncbi:MAG: hypothetical protein QW507_03165 [Candidatus Nanoarchaeia archaeon]|nr:hypothetical protein [Candidatus Haiyanarchaeum thermophilum]MCW1303231.1 hypothetical protein [Candidatus Haiyanarchaeum thermophilum]MCW1304038.1 hypothetical protein [Candidatus Haiyanarchaeum thermophilum]MCW1306777.1 hypothetical protein [Candidatus Haiyanarchaeum thermophilum]MCW1307478.1 hypothetical protein [Candidatus Haiyanarchaeum thermophilum]
MDIFELLGYVAAIFNPIPTGLLAGYALIQGGWERTGRNVMIVSCVWTIVIIYLLWVILFL